MMIFMDTETTGLLKPEPVDLDEQPYIVELYCIKVDDDFQPLGEYNVLIKPPIPLPDTITKITGIRPAQLEGKLPFGNHIDALKDMFLGVKTLIGHNLAFDRGMLINELRRYEQEFSFPWPPQQHCTVEMSEHFQNRRLSLTNLHTLATGKPHAGAHRAKEDVFATVRCYHWLLEQCK